MRTSMLVLCVCALGACASTKSSERGVESGGETSDPAQVNSVERDPAPERKADPEQRADMEPGAVQERSESERAERESDREEPPAADNTGVNDRDEAGALTPTDQGEGASDLEITQNIRKAVMNDDSLSFTAKNVKIITQDGKVTLRGPVNSTKERASIGAAAKKFATGRVDNQLEVAN